jgi:signal transduction histidine kinase
MPEMPVPAGFRRERDVHNLFAAFRDIPSVEDLGDSPDTSTIPSNYSPRPASDASLAAFCQLAAIRLQASRSLISLIDDKTQYILAEATPRTSLKFDSPLNRTVDLGFGNVCLPRRWGICERVLDPVALAEGEKGVIIINDLSKSNLHAARTYVKDGPLRFYAGVPLIACSGNIVGAVCILDDKVRDGLPTEDIQYLQDLSSTIMDYLETYIIKDRYRRGAEGLQGLMSFADGAANLKPTSEQSQGPDSPFPPPGTTGDADQLPTTVPKTEPSKQDTGSHRRNESNSSQPSAPERRLSISDLQDSLVPTTTKEIFARAADIMRKSNDMDGVTFIDASVAATGLQGMPSIDAGKRCQILGYATAEGSSLQGDVLPVGMTPYESNFAWVLEQYPRGYSMDCEEAQAYPWTDNSETMAEKLDPRRGTKPGLQKADRDRLRHVESIQALIPDVKSALFLPLWDFDRGRWFAGCFCWSTRSERILDGRADLPFLKAFGHSIMQEVARLDAMRTDQAKTTFLSSLSHELRTPLHGILGSTHLLRNTQLDSFQGSMINSINACGRTLLETVEHLLDHAERREPSRNYSSKTIPGDNSICIASERLALQTPTPSGKTPQESRCNLGFVTEELVETMIIGQSPFDLAVDHNVSEDSSDDQRLAQTASQRRSRFLILDIGDYDKLGSRLAASSYGRIVLNLFGNALKFTESGFIHVSLRCEHVYGPNATIVLKICDSGIGMKKFFLENHAFEPFRKQNPVSL